MQVVVTVCIPLCCMVKYLQVWVILHNRAFIIIYIKIIIIIIIIEGL